MSGTSQGRDSKLRSRVASAALALLAAFAAGLAGTQSAPAQTFTVLYNFRGPQSDGGNPWAGVIQDQSGNLYGTTTTGGPGGYGVIFELDTAGAETVLHYFTGSDGASPVSNLLRDSSGTLYGTGLGGASGYGVVFQLSAAGTMTVLHSFTGDDGCYPQGAVIMDAKGILYGTASGCGAYGGGTVWKLNQSGKLIVMHNFAGGGQDGWSPNYATLLMDKHGNLYGFTSEGGTSDAGVVYKLTSSGQLTVLYSFAGGSTDGCGPVGAPVMDGKGNLYGTAECGAYDFGVVWKLSSTGAETVLHNFAGEPWDGEYPYAGVVRDKAGNLYGTTELGGPSGYGTVWELSKSGTQSVLQSFAGFTGAWVYGSVLRDASGGLYGTASDGGTIGFGTVWKVTP